MNNPTVPPRFVPTLTEIVHPAPWAPPDVAVTSVAVAGETALPLAELQAQLTQRVLQRVEMVLEKRLREAVGELISRHTQALAEDLRGEIEEVVRQAVTQAFDPENPSPPTRY